MYVPEIRFCGAEDLPALLELNATDLYPWPDAVIVEDLRAGSGVEVVYIGAFATTAEARLLGYAALGRESRAGLIMGLLVRAEHRRLGIATQLLSVAGDCAAYMGLDRLRLRVRRSNAPALALYERMSFTREGVSKGYYSDGEDAIVMSARSPLPGAGR